MGKIQPSEIRWKNINLKDAFKKLKETESELFKHINRALDDIEKNAFCGIQEPKRLIPKMARVSKCLEV
jgi:Txe/YoeB family toxin of Txe-Axe toxin-antitoxin module